MGARINGVDVAVAKALYALIERACRALERRELATLWPVVRKLDVPVGTALKDGDWQWILPAEAFPTSADFARELSKRTRHAQMTAFPLLAEIAVEEATALFVEGARLDLTNSELGSLEADLCRSLWSRWSSLPLPPELLGDLFLRGLFSMEALTDDQLAKIPFDALIEAIIEDKLPTAEAGDVVRLLRVRRELDDLTRRGALAEQIASSGGDFAEDLLQVLMHDLLERGHPSTLPAAVALFERTGPYPVGLDYIIQVHHRPTLERLFAELVRRRVGWDPHHVDLEYAPKIRAGYALDPKTASQRFAPFFTAKAVAGDAGAKLAHDIWLIGFGTLVDHDGTRLRTGTGTMFSADPKWADIAEPLVRHARLGKAARQVLAELKSKPSKKPSKTAPKKAPKKSPTSRTRR